MNLAKFLGYTSVTFCILSVIIFFSNHEDRETSQLFTSFLAYMFGYFSFRLSKETDKQIEQL